MTASKHHYGSRQPLRPPPLSKIDRKRQQEERRLPMEIAALGEQLRRLGRL